MEEKLVGRRYFNLKRELPKLDIPEEHKEVIKDLIDFYEESKRPSIETIISDIEEVAGFTGLFIGAEMGASVDDDLVRKAKKEVDEMFKAIEILKNIWKGGTMETCTFCQNVYDPKESDSSIPDATCSKECEEGFYEHEESIEEYINK